MNIQLGTVTAAFEAIAQENGPPSELNTDEGVEFVNEPFPSMLNRLNITHRIKVGREDLAIIDRRIQLSMPSKF